MIMENQFETVTTANFFLKVLNFLTFKLYDLLAAHTENVVVMTARARPFKKLPLPFSYRLLYDSAFKQKWDGSIDGVAGNSEAFFLEALVEAVRVEMLVEVSDFLVDELPLLRVLQAFLFEKSMKFFYAILWFPHVGLLLIQTVS